MREQRKPASRSADLVAIHVLQKQLGLSPEDAMALKIEKTGKASSAEMTDRQRGRLIGHLRKLLAIRQTGAGSTREHRAADDPANSRWEKARVLWALLARAGAVREDTDTALMTYVRRQTHAEHWRFLNGYQINTVIESLKRWCHRAGVELEETTC